MKKIVFHRQGRFPKQAISTYVSRDTTRAINRMLSKYNAHDDGHIINKAVELLEAQLKQQDFEAAVNRPFGHRW